MSKFEIGQRVAVCWDKAPRFRHVGKVVATNLDDVTVEFSDGEKVHYDDGDLEQSLSGLTTYEGKEDNVNHPKHYTSDPSGVECIEITKHRDFCIGNAIKYLWRCGLKHDADKTDKEKTIGDLQKAIWYINQEIELIKG